MGKYVLLPACSHTYPPITFTPEVDPSNQYKEYYSIKELIIYTNPVSSACFCVIKNKSILTMTILFLFPDI